MDHAEHLMAYLPPSCVSGPPPPLLGRWEVLCLLRLYHIAAPLCPSPSSSGCFFPLGPSSETKVTVHCDALVLSLYHLSSFPTAPYGLVFLQKKRRLQEFPELRQCSLKEVPTSQFFSYLLTPTRP